jgi:hypothetical protein
MKTFSIFFTLLLSGLALSSCTKEGLNAELPESKSYVNPNGDCPASDCTSAIAATKGMYQDLANETCDTIWAEITCCLDGMETYALVYTAPNPVICPSSTATAQRKD